MWGITPMPKSVQRLTSMPKSVQRRIMMRTKEK